LKSQTYLPLLDQMLRPMGLLLVYEYVAANNPANALPYHNLFHTQCMVLTCQRAAQAAQLPVFEREALVVAPLFHDYAHSGGTRSDAENIAVAQAALGDAAAVLGLPDRLVARSLELIATTQYPHVGPALDESERIIRDADMCQLLYGHWFEQVYIGLRAEMAHTRGPMSLAEFCALQHSFLPAVELHSSWGRETQATLHQVSLHKLAMAERVVALMAQHGIGEHAAYAMAKAELPVRLSLAR
jgi:predicted metal-dependent HD superfamily phosphohydrolase